MYKSSFLFFSIALAAAVAGLQPDAARWGLFIRSAVVETRADLFSLDYDARFVRARVKSAPAVIGALLRDFSCAAHEVRADAASQMKVVAERFLPIGQDR